MAEEYHWRIYDKETQEILEMPNPKYATPEEAFAAAIEFQEVYRTDVLNHPIKVEAWYFPEGATVPAYHSGIDHQVTKTVETVMQEGMDLLKTRFGEAIVDKAQMYCPVNHMACIEEVSQGMQMAGLVQMPEGYTGMSIAEVRREYNHTQYANYGLLEQDEDTSLESMWVDLDDALKVDLTKAYWEEN